MNLDGLFFHVKIDQLHGRRKCDVPLQQLSQMRRLDHLEVDKGCLLNEDQEKSHPQNGREHAGGVLNSTILFKRIDSMSFQWVGNGRCDDCIRRVFHLEGYADLQELIFGTISIKIADFSTDDFSTFSSNAYCITFAETRQIRNRHDDIADADLFQEFVGQHH